MSCIFLWFRFSEGVAFMSPPSHPPWGAMPIKDKASCATGVFYITQPSDVVEEGLAQKERDHDIPRWRSSTGFP